MSRADGRTKTGIRIGPARVGRVRGGLLSLWLVSGVLALSCAPADALSQRGHVFAFSFAVQGRGAGELFEPAGVAVDEASGDVYVVDRGNNRIERFGAKGEFIAAWGWGVKDGQKEFEICERACDAGIPGAGRGQLDSPDAIAVDNSTSPSDPSGGDVYVVADGRAEHGHLLKFTREGEPLSPIKQEGVEPKWEGILDGVAVDGAGTTWVYRGVEAEGHIEAFSDAGKNQFDEPGLESSVLCPKPGFAVDSAGGGLYADHERENREGLCPGEEGEEGRPVVSAKLKVEGESVGTAVSALDPSQTTAAATESSTGDVYVENVTAISAFDSAGALIQSVRLPGEGPVGSGIAANAATGDLYVADAAAGKIDVFEPQPPGQPVVDGLSSEVVSPSSAKLSAEIDPAGADTRYYFQYGTVDCKSSPSSCTDVPAAPGVDIGSGFTDQSVAVTLQGLEPSTTYYYRVLAANEHGQAEGAETFGSLTTPPNAAGLLLDSRAWEMVSPAEKDGSGIEPLRNEGGLVQAAEDGNSITYVANGPIVPEPEGNRAPYPTQAIATRGPSGWASQEIVTPRTKGEGFNPGEAPEYRFFSGDLSQGLVQPDNSAESEPFEQPPLSGEATEKTMYVRDTGTGQYVPLVTPESDTAGTKFGGKLEFVDATQDMSRVVLSSDVPLTAGAAAGLYEWQSGQPLQPVSVLPDGTAALEPVLGAESHNVRGALSDDGKRVFWTGESETPVGETTETVRHLYMRDTSTGQTLQIDAATPPIEEPGEEEGEVGFQAANREGTKVFFTDTARLTEDSELAPVPGVPGNPADLYECEVVEENGAPTCKLSDLTVDHNAVEYADVLNVAPAVSEDGSYVYVVANGVLAAGAKPGHCVHSDEEIPISGATCSLYVLHEGTITFIATLSNEDSGDWGSTEGAGPRGESIEPRPDLADVTAGTSPDGEYLAFMSEEPLTAYDNIDSNRAANGSRDEEVYLYDASSKLIVCASCNPSGAPPHGVFDTAKAGEGLGLLVDRRRDWSAGEGVNASTDHWLAGSLPGWTPLGSADLAEALRQPRYLSNAGRLFFDAADPLVHVEQGRTREETVDGEDAEVGVESVYEYEPPGVGTCAHEDGCVGLISSGASGQESAFLDASATGDDAFFVTAQPLVAEDHDTNFDLYDARVCSSQSPCLTSDEASSRPCESSDSCRPAEPPSQASDRPSGSATFSGPGNSTSGMLTVARTREASAPTPRTRAQKLVKALKTCRTRWKRLQKRRASCERQARHSYGARRAGSHTKKRRK